MARSSRYSGGNWSTHNYYHADGNGNITYLVSAAQAMVANYRYDPFGRTTYSGGSLAGANVYRFSSKEVHANSGMYYYGYRFYDPNVQRWLNRDPVGEALTINLYGFVGNVPLLAVDPWGLAIWKCTRTTDAGVGRHAYLWDDRPGPRVNSCGMGARRGRPGPTTNPRDLGPLEGLDPWDPWGLPIPPLYGSVFNWWQSGDYQCVSLPGTQGSEDQIMQHCRECVNSKVRYYGFVVNNCHTACDSVLSDLGIDGPPMALLNPWELPIARKLAIRLLIYR